jgi:hypothetical protein
VRHAPSPLRNPESYTLHPTLYTPKLPTPNPQPQTPNPTVPYPQQVEEGSSKKTLEFEVALEMNAESLVLWSILHYEQGTTSQILRSDCPKLEPDAPVHKLQLAEGKMPMMVYTPTIKDATASFVPIGLGRQKNSDKWRCRFCSLLVDQPGLPEEDMFNRLCALNDPDSRECKVVPPA